MTASIEGKMLIAVLHDLDRAIATAVGPLMGYDAEDLEKLAGLLRDAVKHSDETTDPATKLDEPGRRRMSGLIDALIAAVEFRRAGERYGWIILGMKAEQKLKPKADMPNSEVKS